jgi:PIN domain nuclease of toxin-antitoxin system
MQAEPERLNALALESLMAEANELLFSAVSSWEIAIKYALGKLALPQPPDVHVPEYIERTGVSPLDVSHRHALAVAALPPHHSDPFDRLLIAQAQIERATVLTADHVFAAYDVPMLWAAE